MSPANILSGILIALSLFACNDGRKAPSTTEGEVTIECDESVVPAVRRVVEEFGRSYEKAKVHLNVVEARAAISNYVADSVRHIVMARSLNAEEQEAIALTKGIEHKNVAIALDAIAVVGHGENPIRDLRLSMLDSIMSGLITKWPWARTSPIYVALCDINSSANEEFRNTIMSGREFSTSVTYHSSTSAVLDFVRSNPTAIGIAGVSWLRGREHELRIFRLGQPGTRPDSTEEFGRFYAPVQAHIYRKYYPLTRTVYVYNREVLRDVGLGFISFAASAPGQKLFLSEGLVPVTMPVRLVELTSKDVQ